jgi:methylase of polypeptide subunit release factors
MIVNLCGGQLDFAPIGKHPQRILDSGTGTGIWCIDSGYPFPVSILLFV